MVKKRKMEEEEIVKSKKVPSSETWRKYPIMNKILTRGIERLSVPFELVTSARVAPIAVKRAKPNK